MKLVTLSRVVILVSASLGGLPASTHAQDRSLRESPELAAYFEAEVRSLEKQNELARFKSSEEWQDAKPQLREQLFDMLGLSPRPEKTPLEAVTTGTTDEAEFVVERVHFQSLPGLYVTGNFYRPNETTGPLPTILYVCGHGQVKKDGISFGNKTHYHYHGAWFARNGYNCLIIDTLQLGEIEGVHHGTYRMNRWWWNSRGYTPAGVEAWNCIRALDYLETRHEVDAAKIGVTGRSGGGAYSWWVAALDDRIQCAVPVAGITSLRDHVITGCVEGHCDCMYMVNTFRWDFATVAALVAPRPLLISNTDKDSIFPLEGVVDIHRQVRHIYRLVGAESNLGLQITEGPHEDTQELHIHAFHWFNRFLKNDKSLIETTAVKFFEPEQLKVLSQTPADEINTRVDELFVPLASLPSPEAILRDQEIWFKQRTGQLRDRCFRAWPDADRAWNSELKTRTESLSVADLNVPGVEELQWVRIHFDSQTHVRLFVDAFIPRDQTLESLENATLYCTEELTEAVRTMVPGDGAASKPFFVFSPRGMGAHRWSGDEFRQIQIQRRFQLLGTTVDAMRIWDIRRAIHCVRALCPALKPPFRIESDSNLEPHGLLASLYEPAIGMQHARSVDANEEHWPSILNLSRTIRPQEIMSLVLWKNGIELSAEFTQTDVMRFAEDLASDRRWKGNTLGKAAQ